MHAMAAVELDFHSIVGDVAEVVLWLVGVAEAAAALAIAAAVVVVVVVVVVVLQLLLPEVAGSVVGGWPSHRVVRWPGGVVAVGVGALQTLKTRAL